MPVAWRLVRDRYAKSAFDGEGSFRHGGRWNSRGVRVAYTSANLSLAVLELLVHLNGPSPLSFVAIRLQFDDALVEQLPLESLPVGWNSQPPGQASRSLGDAWARAANSAILQVPSVLVPIEANYLINPQHPDFASVQADAPSAFAFDQRLFTVA